MVALLLVAICAGAAPLGDGVALYQSLEFERAAIHFQGIALDVSASPADRAQAAVWAGLSLGQLGDVDGARRAFALAVATDLQVEAPVDAPPALRAMLDEERAAAAARAAAVAPPPDPLPPTPVQDPPPDPIGNTPPAPPAKSSPTVDWPAIGTGAVAGVLVVAAVGAGVYGAARYASSADPNVPARPAFEAYDQSVVAGWTAVGLGSGAAVVGGVATVLFVLE